MVQECYLAATSSSTDGMVLESALSVLRVSERYAQAIILLLVVSLLHFPRHVTKYPALETDHGSPGTITFQVIQYFFVEEVALLFTVQILIAQTAPHLLFIPISI
jgi:hypothetical protein